MFANLLPPVNCFREATALRELFELLWLGSAGAVPCRQLGHGVSVQQNRLAWCQVLLGVILPSLPLLFIGVNDCKAKRQVI